MKTFSNAGNAKRAAKKAGLDVTTLNFVTGEDGRTGWEEQAASTIASATPHKAAKPKAAKPKAAKPAATEAETIPQPTIKGQGRLAKRTSGGLNLATKSGRVRAIIAKEFNTETPNPEHCITLIRNAEGFTRNLGRIYFANNLPKVFGEFATADADEE